MKTPFKFKNQEFEVPETFAVDESFQDYDHQMEGIIKE
jgi:hypothetical protein